MQQGIPRDNDLRGNKYKQAAVQINRGKAAVTTATVPSRVCGNRPSPESTAEALGCFEPVDSPVP